MPAKKTTKKATKRTPKTKAVETLVQETVDNPEKGASLRFRSNGL